MEKEDLYAILQLEDNGPHITNATIRKAYHKRALEIHPDKFKGNSLIATQQFQKLKMAYEILSDKKVRAIYDEWHLLKKEAKVRMEHKKAMKKEKRRKREQKKKEESRKFVFNDDFRYRTFEFKNGLFVGMGIEKPSTPL